MLYECLTGQAPFRGKDARDLIIQTIALRVKPPRGLRPEVPPGLEAFVLQLLSRDPQDRPASAAAAVAALEVLAGRSGESSAAWSPPVWSPEFVPGEQKENPRPQHPRMHASLHDTLHGPTVDVGLAE